MDRRTRLVRLAGMVTAALLSAVILVIQPQDANALIGNVIPMNEFEEPTDSFTTANALFAYVTVDPFGGRVCVVPETTTNPGDGSLSCDSAVSWASPNFVSGIGSQIIPIKGPSLKVGTWKLLGDSSQGAPDALSIPFTVSPCLNCDTSVAQSIVNEWKAAAQQARGGISGVCTATALYSLFNSVKKAGKLIRLVREDAPAYQFVALAVGTTLGFSITAPFSELTFIKKGTGMIQDLSCAVRMMYDDIIADPSDPNFGEVVVPRPYVTSVSGDPLIDSLSQEFSDVAAFGEAQRISFERYFGAIEAGNLQASALQAGAIADFGTPLVESMRDLADGLRAFGDEADADPNENDPVTTEAQLQDTIAIYQRVRQNGFTSEELQQLQDAGLGAAEIAVVDQAFDLDIETAPVNTSYTTVLHNAADHLDQAANVFNEVSLDAGAVAATIRAISEANQPPVANGDTLTTDQDAPASVNVLANDSDPDPGDTLAVVGSTNGAHGTVSCEPAGDCTYTPAAGYTGPDSFTYTVSDGRGGTAIGTVLVTVTPPQVNHPPVANDGSLTTAEDTPKELTLQASDPDEDSLTYTIVSGPSHGSTTGTGATRTYWPAANYNGPDSFTFRANDGSLESNIATVSITVTPVNDPPVAGNGSLETNEDTPAYVTLVGNDVEGDGLSYVVVSGPEHGSLTGTGATRTYTPALDYYGPDSFSFKVNDGLVDSNLATVSITVNPVLDGDVARARLFAGSDNKEFTGEPTDRFAAVEVDGPVVNDLGLVSTDFPVNGIEVTPTGTLLSGDPFTNLQREMTLGGELLGSVTTPFPPGPCCKEDFAYDGNHIWRAFWPSTIGEYLPNGTPVREYAQDDVVGMAFVGSTLWITKWGAHQVGTFNPATNTFTPMFSTASNAGGLAYDPEHHILWVGRGGGIVEAWDLQTLTLIAGSSFRPFGNISNTIDGLAFRSSADLELSKGDDPDPAAVSEQLTYTLTLKNNGPDRAATPTITDPLPPEVTFVSASPGCAESSHTVTCTFASLAAGATASATIVVQPTEPGAAINEATASSSTPDPNATNNKATQTTSLVVSSKTTSTTYTGGVSTQYSDPVTLSGVLRDTSVDPNIGIAGRQLDFKLGTQSKGAGPTAPDGSASTSLVVTQQPGSVTSIETAFAGDATYLASSDSDPFTIAKEDCTLGYSGDLSVAPTAMTTLAADLGEPDATLGDRSNKTVVFTVTGVVNPTPRVFLATTDANGRASMLVPLGSDVYAVAVSFSGDPFYKSCATTQDAVVTVEAAAAKVTGGGWTSISTGRTNFGFNAIPEAGGLWKGQFQLRSNNNKSKFHARAVSTLSTSGNSATWSGTGTWNGQANYTYMISVVDNGSSGSKKGDKISITITSPTGAVVFSTGGFQTLKGGNVTVH